MLKRASFDLSREVPKLEKWFKEDTYPSEWMVAKYCVELNCEEYRQKLPKLEPKSVKQWFHNHRAKVKCMKTFYGGLAQVHAETEGLFGQVNLMS